MIDSLKNPAEILAFFRRWERDESRIDRSTLEALPVVFHRVARVCPLACRDDFEVIVSGNEGTEGSDVQTGSYL